MEEDTQQGPPPLTKDAESFPHEARRVLGWYARLSFVRLLYSELLRARRETRDARAECAALRDRLLIRHGHAPIASPSATPLIPAATRKADHPAHERNEIFTRDERAMAAERESISARAAQELSAIAAQVKIKERNDERAMRAAARALSGKLKVESQKEATSDEQHSANES